VVLLVAVPAVGPAVTVTLNVQVPPGAIVAPLSVMVGGVADSVPPHSGVAAMGGTVTIEGTGSENPTPVRVVVAFPLVMVKVSVEVAPERTEDGEKVFVIKGGETTVI